MKQRIIICLKAVLMAMAAMAQTGKGRRLWTCKAVPSVIHHAPAST